MSFPPGQSHFHRKTAPTDAKKSRRTYIDPNDFHLMRHRAFLTVRQTSKLLDVSFRTVKNWEGGISPIPYTAYRVLKMKVGYLFNDEFFKDWFVRGDTLWSPEGRAFKAHELRYISHYFWMARQWLAERQTLKNLSVEASAKLPRACATFSRLPVLDSTIASEAASGVSPTPSGQKQPEEIGTRTPCGVTPLRDTEAKRLAFLSQQTRPADFEKFLEALGIPA